MYRYNTQNTLINIYCHVLRHPVILRAFLFQIWNNIERNGLITMAAFIDNHAKKVTKAGWKTSLDRVTNIAGVLVAAMLNILEFKTPVSQQR